MDLTVREWRFLQQWLRTFWILCIWRCVVWYEIASGSAGSAVPILMTDEAARGSLRKTRGQYLRDVCVRRPPGVSERWGSPWGSLKWRINLTQQSAATLRSTRSAGTSYRHSRYLPRNFGNGTCEQTDCATTCPVALGLFIVVMHKEVFGHSEGCDCCWCLFQSAFVV